MLFAVALPACRESAKGAQEPPFQQGASGSQARGYLSSTPYTTLRVEVDYIAGRQPSPQALDTLTTRLLERCDKPAGVSVFVDDAIPDQGIALWRVRDIVDLELRFRDEYSSGSRADMYFVYLNDRYESDTSSQRVLGIAYSGSALAIFMDNIRDSATLTLTAPTLEQAVLVHEAGHNLGLVDNGTPMQSPHEDAQHPAHDTNQDCVMYWAVESSLVSQVLGTVPDQFDAACRADLQAAGGK